MRKIVVSDYDGTFFLNKKEIKKNVEEVNEFRTEKNLFVIATGNNLRTFKKAILENNIKYDYLILDQGACIFDNKETLLKACFLEQQTSKELINEIGQKYKEYKLYNPYTETEDINENITKISVNITDLQEAISFTSKINNEFKGHIHAYTMIFNEINIVEIVSAKIDKSEAIKYIADKENVLKSNIYTIGNGYNDISMIQNFNGYCMKSSVKELLNKCKNSVDSVADLIEKVMYVN